jgi:hypothetical protein
MISTKLNDMPISYDDGQVRFVTDDHQRDETKGGQCCALANLPRRVTSAIELIPACLGCGGSILTRRCLRSLGGPSGDRWLAIFILTEPGLSHSLKSTDCCAPYVIIQRQALISIIERTGGAKGLSLASHVAYHVLSTL